MYGQAADALGMAVAGRLAGLAPRRDALQAML